MPPENQVPSTSSGSATPLITSDSPAAGDNSTAAGEKDPKTGKRRLFGLGSKKKDEKEKSMAAPAPAATMASPSARAPELKPSTAQPIPVSPSRHPYPSIAAASPSRLRSSSPRLHSPASSEIFERNVQEPVPIADLQAEGEAASHIPTHVITEDHIPPALEASAQAITSEELNPDEVEIVMSSSHQPAAASVLEGGNRESQADLTSLQSPMSPLQPVRSEDSEHAPSGILPPPGGEEGDGASNYAQLDPNDVRRLSFISFADVVQSEHQQPPASALGEPGSRDSLHIASLPGSFKAERAGSPLRSPPSTHSQSISGVTTPPPGVSVNAAEASSPVSPHPQGHGDLTVETMRQAVRKTASGDLTGGGTGRASAAMSPVESDGNRSRTNS